MLSLIPNNRKSPLVEKKHTTEDKMKGIKIWKHVTAQEMAVYHSTKVLSNTKKYLTKSCCLMARESEYEKSICLAKKEGNRKLSLLRNFSDEIDFWLQLA